MSNFIGNETQAQIPSAFNAKKHFNDDRRSVQIFMMPNSDGYNCTTTKNNYTKYRDTKLKSKFIKHMPGNRSTDMKLNFEKGGDRSRGPDYKKTEFIIPKNLSRKTSEEKDTLSKYLKENPNVQSLGYGNKPRGIQKSLSISTGSSLTRIVGNTRSKAKNLLIKNNSSLERPTKEGLMMSHSHIKIPKTSQSNYTDIITGVDKSNLKKHQVYLMKKSGKRGFSKKKSLCSNKYTILKSKKNASGEMRYKNKSEQISPKSKNNLYNYRPVSHQEAKPKITMNVSIDLSQNQNKNVSLVENNYFQNISARRKGDKSSFRKTIKAQKHQQSLIMEEDTEKEGNSTKRKSVRKYPKLLAKNNESQGLKKKLSDPETTRSKKRSIENYIKFHKPSNQIKKKSPTVDERMKHLKKDDNSFVKMGKFSEEQKYSDILESLNLDDMPLSFSKINEDSKNPADG